MNSACCVCALGAQYSNFEAPFLCASDLEKFFSPFLSVYLEAHQGLAQALARGIKLGYFTRPRTSLMRFSTLPINPCFSPDDLGIGHFEEERMKRASSGGPVTTLQATYLPTFGGGLLPSEKTTNFCPWKRQMEDSHPPGSAPNCAAVSHVRMGIVRPSFPGLPKQTHKPQY